MQSRIEKQPLAHLQLLPNQVLLQRVPGRPAIDAAQMARRKFQVERQSLNRRFLRPNLANQPLRLAHNLLFALAEELHDQQP